MDRPRYVSAGVVVLAGIVVLTGCGEDPKQRIVLLEGENQQLLDQLAASHDEMDTLRRDRDLCEQELASVRADNSTLMGRVTELETAEPEVPAGWQAVPGGAMIALEGEVLFDFAKAELRPAAQTALDAVVRTIASQYPSHEILVYGHTDNVRIGPSAKKWKDNLALSAQRAVAVVRYLQGRGVSPGRLVAGGCGEHRPAVPNTSEANRAKNRRVEIYALKTTLQTASR